MTRNERCRGWFGTRMRRFTYRCWVLDPVGFCGCRSVVFQSLLTNYSLTCHNSSTYPLIGSWVGSSYRSVRSRSIYDWWWNESASIEIASGCTSSRTMATHTSHRSCKSNPSNTSTYPSYLRNTTGSVPSYHLHQSITTTTKIKMLLSICSPPHPGNPLTDDKIHSSCSSQPGMLTTRTTITDLTQYKIDPHWRCDQHPQTIRFFPWCRQF